MSHRSTRHATFAAALLVGAAACASDTTTTEQAGSAALAEATIAPDDVSVSADEQRFPDVIDAVATPTDSGWTFAVTISSPYDTPERYADGWRIVGPDGTDYGFRLLTHDHASEQPFTRTLDDVDIPDDVDTVIIEGRDQQYGFGGATFELSLPSR